MDLSPGSVIAGRYRVDKRVGAGGMGEVWAGEHLSIGIKVAVKTLLPAAAVNHEVQARFKREAFLLGRIRSEYVARVLDFVNDDEYGLVIVMEFVEGDSLAKILSYKRLTVEETVDLGADAASALADLHRAHIVHRDLKPGNIILQPMPGGRRRAVVVDFGVSRMVSAGDDEEDTITGITKANMAVGTVEYMAPEQILNSRDVTGSSDCYALGAILYRAVTGHHVFGEIYDSELAHTKLTQDAGPLDVKRTDRVAKGLEAAVAKALKRRPSERYATSEAMLADLMTLRDLSRVSAVELGDSSATTMDVTPIELAAMAPPPPSRPSHESAPRSSPSGQIPPVEASEPRAMARSIPGPGAAAPISEPGPAKAGISRGAAVAGITLALAAGLAGGALLMGRLGSTGAGALAAPATAPTASPTATATAAAASATPSPSSEPVAAASGSAESAPATIDLGELEPTPGPLRPRSSASGASSAPPGSSAGKPAASAKAGPAGSGKGSAPPPVEKIEF